MEPVIQANFNQLLECILVFHTYFTSPDETNSMKGAMTTTSKPGIPPLKQRETSRYRGKWPEGP